MINNDKPLVSVIVPCYNHEKYIKESLLSILNQTYNNIQLIVIDDGSKDNSVDIIKSLQPTYNFIFEAQQNEGVSKTLNNAIKKYATGKYIAFLASDDYWELNKLEKQILFLEKNDTLGMVCGKARIVNNQSKIVGALETGNASMAFNFNNIALGKRMVAALTVVLKKDVLDKVGLFDEDLAIEDLDMWLRIAHIFPIGFMDEKLAFYRQHDTNASSKVITMAKARSKILQKWKNIDSKIFDKIKRNWDLVALSDFGKTNREEALDYYNPTFKNFLNARYRRFILNNFLKGHF
jgi:alpha-1,3-rhamnosyltransferase